MMPLFNPRDVVACIHAFPERIIDILTVTRILRVVRRLFRLDQQWLLSHRAIDLQRAIQERHGCRHNVSDDRRGECALHVARCVIGNKIYAARGDRSGDASGLQRRFRPRHEATNRQATRVRRRDSRSQSTRPQSRTMNPPMRLR